MSPWGQRVATVFLAFHLLMMAGSLLVDLPVGAAIRTLTGPYERFAGVYQGWDMFAPNAPRVTTWVEVEGRTAAGERVALPSISDDPDDRKINLRYLRRDKLGRNLAQTHRATLQRSAADRACAVSKAEGAPLRAVHLVALRRSTPTPGARRAGEAPILKRETLLERRCR